MQYWSGTEGGPTPTDPIVLAALVSAIVALIISSIGAWGSIWLQKDRLRTELKLEFSAEGAISQLLSLKRWKLRSFEEISRRLRGFEKDELRKLLIRSGAVCFERRSDGEELWGLRERNRDKLEQLDESKVD